MYKEKNDYKSELIDEISSESSIEECCYVCGLSNNEEVLLICDMVFFYFLINVFNIV